MFPGPLTIVYGHDQPLLDSRCRLLERDGYHAVALDKLSHVRQQMDSAPVCLLILCHTLDMEECGRAIALASSQHPPVKTLILQTIGSKDAPVTADSVLDTRDGPGRFIAAVQQLVAF